MYLSRIRLQNWRSYEDCTLEFSEPKHLKPLTLVGAMNGHGKTSLLISLYLGLFGRFGLRYCEGFDTFQENLITHYSKAISMFRRRQAEPSEPSIIDIELSVSALDTNDVQSIRIVRRWYFSASGKPKSGSNFEEADLFIDGKAIEKVEGLDSVSIRLEKLLFPARIMPAFFFDGEQAQTLVNKSGGEGVRRAVEVMFGAKELQELREQLKSYISSRRMKHGGKIQSTSKHIELDKKVKERDELENLLNEKEVCKDKSEREKDEFIKDRDTLQSRFSKLGGEQVSNLDKITALYAKASNEKNQAEREVSNAVKKLGIALAASRLSRAVHSQLNAEEIRENWENLRDGTLEKGEEVLSKAMPEPAEEDPILGILSDRSRGLLRERIVNALEVIYNPPPNGCAERVVFGHVRGEHRKRVVEMLDIVNSYTSPELSELANTLRRSREVFFDSKARVENLKKLPEELKDIQRQLNDINNTIQNLIQKIGQLDNQIKVIRADRSTLTRDITLLEDEIAKMEPEMKRIAVAEKTVQALEDVIENLEPFILEQLQTEITRFFLSIADNRFEGSCIQFNSDNQPMLILPDGSEQPIEMMSGFERRSFGIAFSLALIEITKHRLPLIIDTPMGNADSEYRPRLLDAISKVNLDQVILLTHDQEITHDVAQTLEERLNDTFLIEFDTEDNASYAYKGEYFEGKVLQ